MQLVQTLDEITVDVGASAWASLGNGTALVLVTALLLALFGRRVPAGAQALLWTVALLKFVVPCGPAVFGSLSRGLQLAGDPIPVDARQVLAAGAHPGALAAKTALLAVYLGAVVWLALRAVRRYRRMLAEARALPPADQATVARVRACAERLAVRAPEVRVSERAVSPQVAGVARPVLVMPRWLAGRGDAEAAFVLHELAHLRRRDHWLLLAIAAIEIVFFFWPPVRFAAARLRGAREAACDATAVTLGPLGAAAYARSLVGAARSLGPRPESSLVLAGAVTSRLEERVDFLLRGRRPVHAAWLVAALAVWLVWSLGGAQRIQPVAAPCSQLQRG